MSEITKKVAEQMLADLAQEIFINENRKFTAAALRSRFETTANNYRRDITIQQVARVVSAMADREPHRELSSSDLEDLANKFYSPDSAFREEFHDLLQSTASQQGSRKTQANRLDYAGDYRRPDEVKDSATEVDDFDSEASIEAMIDPSLIYAKQDLATIRYAATLVEEELKATQRVTKAALKLKHKTPELFIYQASFKTASGEANVFVPVELRSGNPLIPQLMTTTEKVYSLDTSGVDALSEDLAYNNYTKEALAASRLRTDAGMSDHIRDDHMGTVEVDEFEDLPQKSASLGIAEIDDVLRNAVARKESRFASNTIDYGRDLVTIELNDLGYRKAQVAYVGDYDRGLVYKASINTEIGKFDITVPVETSKGMLLNPYQFEANDQVHELTAAALSQVVKEANPQEEVHPLLYTMSYPELKKQLKNAAYQHKPKLAKSVLALIEEKFDSYYHNAAIDDYQTWLEEASTTYKTRCGSCNHYHEKTAHSADWCNLVKTATKNVNQDEDSNICTRSIFTEDEDDRIVFDDGLSIKL